MMMWSGVEVGALARAVSHAPSIHNSQPWVLQTRPGGADLYERLHVTMPRHDPAGRDRVISCGAALTNLSLAMRALGRTPAVTLLPDPDQHPDLVASVDAGEEYETTAEETALYAAIFRRRSYRAPFNLYHVPPSILTLIMAATATPGAEARLVHGTGEASALAELLDYTGRILRGDRAYQRELQAWYAQFHQLLPTVSTLPWSGLVRADTHLPDTITLTERLEAESLLMIVTTDDTRLDHLHAGMALQRAWLTAVSHDLAGSVLTQPLQLHEVRAGLIEKLGLAGYPQAILRLGYPVSATPALSGKDSTGKARHAG